MILTTRLERILSYVPVCDVVADIGTDHGKVAVALIERGIAKRVYATDISAKSLSKAQALIRDDGIEDRCVCLVGDGLAPICDKDVDSVVIAGMGGMEIISVLDKGKCNASTFVLSPHKDTIALRRYLVSHGYKIELDSVVESEDRFYFVIRASVGQDALTSDEEIFGRTNLQLRSQEFLAYLKHELEVLYSIRQGVSGDTLVEFDTKISLYERILNDK